MFRVWSRRTCLQWRCCYPRKGHRFNNWSVRGPKKKTGGALQQHLTLKQLTYTAHLHWGLEHHNELFQHVQPVLHWSEKLESLHRPQTFQTILAERRCGSHHLKWVFHVRPSVNFHPLQSLQESQVGHPWRKCPRGRQPVQKARSRPCTALHSLLWPNSEPKVT